MSDFTIIPDNSIDESIEFDVMMTGFENAVEQSRRRSLYPRRNWTLGTKNRTWTEIKVLIDFFTSKSGNYSSFTWTSPNDRIEYTVRFAESSFSFLRSGYDVYEATFKLIEKK